MGGGGAPLGDYLVCPANDTDAEPGRAEADVTGSDRATKHVRQERWQGGTTIEQRQDSQIEHEDQRILRPCWGSPVMGE